MPKPKPTAPRSDTEVCGACKQPRDAHDPECPVGQVGETRTSTQEAPVPHAYREMVPIPAADLEQMVRNAKEWAARPLSAEGWVREKLWLDMQLMQHLAEKGVPGRSGVGQRRQCIVQFVASANALLGSLAKLKAADPE